MGRARVKQSFRLRLLAFVLALALAWYSLNPAPGPVHRIKREDEPPDEKKREAQPELRGAGVFPGLLAVPGARPWEEPPVSERDEDDDFEWPEFIDA